MTSDKSQANSRYSAYQVFDVKLRNIISIIPLSRTEIYFQRYVDAFSVRDEWFIREGFLFELRNGQMANVGGGKIM